MNRILTSLLLLIIGFQLSAQSLRVEPPHWYADMKNDTVQLMIYYVGEAAVLEDCSVTVDDESVDIVGVHKADSPNYLFVDVVKRERESAFAVRFSIENEGELIRSFDYNFQMIQPVKRGFDARDAVYLIMPDRFANGNPDNDSSAGVLEQANRSNPDGRHGGDIQGVIDNVDYIADLGMTAVWLTPFLENNMKDYSYHGYSTTDYYQADERMGSNADYLRLSRSLRERDMKLIMDIVLNHIGINHWWMEDLPYEDWLNHNENFVTNYRGGVMADPYVSEYDRKKMVEGWFVPTMPDLNQHNPYLATYLKQAALWWIAYAELSGFRVDTQPYVFEDFMSEWSQAIKAEFPDFTILGESWLQKIGLTSYFEGKKTEDGRYNSRTDVITDFPMHFAIASAFNEEQDWTHGIIRLYYILSQDFLYDDPMNNLIFMDNHDLSRILTLMDMDVDKVMMATTFLLTTRGIPMLYYGTEALLYGDEHQGHGFIRKDMPGGWGGDTTDVFKGVNMSDEQKDYMHHFKTLTTWRKANPELALGKLVQFIPDNNLYVYFRSTEGKKAMVIINNDDEDRKLELSRFVEMLGDASTGKEIINGENIDFTKGSLDVPARTSYLVEIN